jgi:ABC-type taurine transport system ATPase subunit
MMKSSTGYAIPINLVLASIVAVVFTGSHSGVVLESDIPLLGIAMALVIQEILLVQWLSATANVDYTKRLIGSQISVNKRLG